MCCGHIRKLLLIDLYHVHDYTYRLISFSADTVFCILGHFPSISFSIWENHVLSIKNYER